MRTIYEQPYRTLGESNDGLRERPERDVRYLLSAAIAVGGLIALLAGIVLTALAWLAWTALGWWQALPAAGVTALVIWAGVTSLMGRRWILKHIHLPWDEIAMRQTAEWEERERRWRYEDAAWEEAHRHVEGPAPAEKLRGEEMAQAMRTILDLHYVMGKAATRPECERAGVSQPAWNLVNLVLRELQLKGERGWEDVASVDAYTRVSTRVTWLEDGRARVRVSSDNEPYHYETIG